MIKKSGGASRRSHLDPSLPHSLARAGTSRPQLLSIWPPLPPGSTTHWPVVRWGSRSPCGLGIKALPSPALMLILASPLFPTYTMSRRTIVQWMRVRVGAHGKRGDQRGPEKKRSNAKQHNLTLLREGRVKWNQRRTLGITRQKLKLTELEAGTKMDLAAASTALQREGRGSLWKRLNLRCGKSFLVKLAALVFNDLVMQQWYISINFL